jgi:predicted RNase H-like HicB family nuclease
MTKHFYPAVFHQEDIGYSVFFPDLKGCNTEGDTLEESYEMAFDALGLYLEDVPESEYPAKTNPKEIKLEENEFMAIIEFDVLSYKKKHGAKAVKKTLTIPSWLNELAEEKHISFSGLLQAALKDHLGINSTQR